MPLPPDKIAKQAALDKGELAEELVAQWLIEQGWEILERRWRCRMGELDLIAYRRPIAPKTLANLAFIEVKARSSGNWDADGMLAVNTQKQLKLWRSAKLFLATHSTFAELPCSFDVALVHCRRAASQIPQGSPKALESDNSPVELGKSRAIAGYFLTLTQYIPNAFNG